jgi:serine/threonine-protein phosphatase 4 regulatory subunit 1
MESALISMGPFIATFADSDKTGLYYVGNGMVTVHPIKLLENSSCSDKNENCSNGDSGYAASESQSQHGEPQLDQLFPTLSLQDDSQSKQGEANTEEEACDQSESPIQGEQESGLTQEIELQEPFSISKSDNTEHDLKEEDLSYSFDERKDDNTWSESLAESISSRTSEEEKKEQPLESLENDGLKAEFNHFLYWREPLPSIEFEIQAQFTHDTQFKQFNQISDDQNIALMRNSDTRQEYSVPDDSNVFYNNLTCSNYSNNEQNVSHLLNGSEPQDCSRDVLNANTQDKVIGPLSLWTLSNYSSPNGNNEQKYFAQYPDFYQNVQQQLGTIEQDIVPNELLEHFVNMSTNNYMSDLYTTDITYHCAYSLPAVAFTLGPDHWQCLRRTFFNLVRNMSTNIRCILASSLYPIALIIGREHTSRDLFSAFKLFLTDMDEIRARLVPTFIPFFKLLNAQERDCVLSKLSLFMNLENFLNWRFRVTFCELFQELIPFYTKAADFKKYIIQIVFMLLKDKVAEVRNASVRVAAAVVKHLYELEELYPMPVQLLEMICDFSKARNWFIRQTFVGFCNHVLYDSIIPIEQFEEHLFGPLLCLVLDPVPNVRLTVSRLIGRLPYSDKKELVKLLKVQAAIRMLAVDADKDVREQLDLYGDCTKEFGSPLPDTNEQLHTYETLEQAQKMEIGNCELNENEKEQLTLSEESAQEEVQMDYTETNQTTEYDWMQLPRIDPMEIEPNPIFSKPSFFAEPMNALLVLDQDEDEENLSIDCRLSRQLHLKSQLPNQPTLTD